LKYIVSVLVYGEVCALPYNCISILSVDNNVVAATGVLHIYKNGRPPCTAIGIGTGAATDNNVVVPPI